MTPRGPYHLARLTPVKDNTRFRQFDRACAIASAGLEQVTVRRVIAAPDPPPDPRSGI